MHKGNSLLFVIRTQQGSYSIISRVSKKITISYLSITSLFKSVFRSMTIFKYHSITCYIDTRIIVISPFQIMVKAFTPMTKPLTMEANLQVFWAFGNMELNYSFTLHFHLNPGKRPHHTFYRAAFYFSLSFWEYRRYAPPRPHRFRAPTKSYLMVTGNISPVDTRGKLSRPIWKQYFKELTNIEENLSLNTQWFGWTSNRVRPGIQKCDPCTNLHAGAVP
jgi:hypothetical protein